MICLGYKLRWQVELLFKEWKSYTNLHKFDTEKETIAEALIWASLSAAAIKRFLAHAAEHRLEVVISTRKASMPSAYAFPELFRALRYGDGPWYRRAFKAMIHYLGRNARRAHPERDARTGRSRLGLNRSSNSLIRKHLQTIVSNLLPLKSQRMILREICISPNVKSMNFGHIY